MRFDSPIPKPIVHSLPRLSTEYGVSLYVMRDDLFPYYYGGNKARKFLYIIKDIEPNGYNAIVTNGGVQSNHCRVVALGCAERQMPCILVLHGKGSRDNPVGNERLMRLTGAQIINAIPERISITIKNALNQLRKRGYKPYELPGGGHCLAGALAYFDAMRQVAEVCKKLRWLPDYIFLASGTGGTQAGILAGVKKLGWQTRVIGISVARERKRGTTAIYDLYKRLANKIGISYKINEIDFRDGWVSKGYGKYDKVVLKLIGTIAKKEGILLDPTYTGKAFQGMLSILESGEVPRKSKVLFWHTGGIFNLLATKEPLRSYL